MYSSKMLRMLKPVVILRHHERKKSSFHRGVHFLFKKNLFLTNSITSGGFMAVGDLIQQEFEVQSNLLPARYDWARIVRMLIVGTAMGPLHHYYYIYLDKLMPLANFTSVTKKILSDQFLASPATIFCFFYGMGLLEGKTMDQCTEEIKKKFAQVYMGDWLFWPPVQFVNFYYLPTHYRVFYINFATMIFNVFLSFMKHFDQHKKC